MPAHSIDGSAESIAAFAIVFECAGRTGEWVLAMDTAAGRAIADSITRDLAPSPESFAYRSCHEPRENADVIAAAPEGRVVWVPHVVGRPTAFTGESSKEGVPTRWMWSAIRR